MFDTGIINHNNARFYFLAAREWRGHQLKLLEPPQEYYTLSNKSFILKESTSPNACHLSLWIPKQCVDYLEYISQYTTCATFTH